MPNWCHNTLTVTGEADELARFVEAAQPTEEALRQDYDEMIASAQRSIENIEKYGDNEKEVAEARKMLMPPPWEEFFAQNRTPLSFNSLVPQPPSGHLRKLERYKPCTMCGAYGTLPDSEEQANERGARWFEWMDPDKRPNRTCNVCSGSKEERVGSEGWYTWRLSAWGTKWDASFSKDGVMFAVGAEGMDPEITQKARGATITPTVAIYKFDTPWSPPSPVIETASDKFPELEFTLQFAEIGNGYAGREKYVAGLLIESEELEVEDVLAPEEMWF